MWRSNFSAGLGRLTPDSLASDAIVRTDFSTLPPYGNGTIPAGIRLRHIAGVNGLTVHILGTDCALRG
jgi:hypothetical protein